MKLNKVRQAAYDQTRELVTLRARFAAAQQENDGNKQIESDLLAMQAERDELRVTLDEALGLLQKLDTLSRHPYFVHVPHMPGLERVYSNTADFLSRLDGCPRT